ncbi:MAG: hypothetical protein EOM37_06320 [Proteobacteria bacterium]|jgi:hypothetical protein|nr:hypothetical protein [Alphaproteobacteria bacterium]NCC03645.1 hypothetical protein [Pseudomonadota bacterium]
MKRFAIPIALLLLAGAYHYLGPSFGESQELVKQQKVLSPEEASEVFRATARCTELADKFKNKFPDVKNASQQWSFHYSAKTAACLALVNIEVQENGTLVQVTYHMYDVSSDDVIAEVVEGHWDKDTFEG